MTERTTYPPQDLFREIKETIHKQWGMESESISKIILEEEFKISSIDIILNKDFHLSEDKKKKLQGIVDRLLKGEPIQYILGFAYFMGHRIRVNNSTLIPRQETEQLVELVKSLIKTNTPGILDIGTGSGCIAISLALQIKGSRVYGLDINPGAIQIARENAQLLNADVRFVQHDIFKPWKNKIRFDVIVSNPPYVTFTEMVQMSKSVINFEPNEALFVPTETPLMFYQEIIKMSYNVLNPQGLLCFEINEMYGQEILFLMQEKGFNEVKCEKDIHGKDRFVYGFR